MKRYVDADQMIKDTEAMKYVSDAICIDGIIKYIKEHSVELDEIATDEWRCKYYQEDGCGQCFGQKGAPFVNCEGDRNKCEQ